MEVEQKNKPTEMQWSIFNFCKSYSGINSVNDIYKEYTKTNKCNKDYFVDVIGVRWLIFREDGKVWVDFDTPIGEQTWTTLENSLPSS